MLTPCGSWPPTTARAIATTAPLVGDTSPYRTEDYNVVVELQVNTYGYQERAEHWSVTDDPHGYPQAPTTATGDPAISITIEFPQSHPFAHALTNADNGSREAKAESDKARIQAEIAKLQDQLSDLD